jgi:hypothetical protein
VEHLADIIPLASRRPRPAAPVALAATTLPAPKRPAAGPIAVLAGFIAVLAIGAAGLAAQAAYQSPVRDLPGATRAPIFQRAYEDLRATCGVPEAAAGSLRDHCVEQARFVLLFAECDAACANLARATLPRAHR